MNLPRRRFLQLAAAAAALPTHSGRANAQAFPLQPITIVVPFAAGGPIDALVRVLVEAMRDTVGQPLVAGFWGTHVVNGAIYALPYDVVNDFEPILLMSRNAQIIVARKTMPANDLKGLIDWLKANPDVAAAGTSGAGSPQHVFGVFFQQATGTHFRFVPYRGAAPTMQDLVGGQIDLMFADQTTSLPQVRSGNIRAYAVTGQSRLAAAPDIPTVDEAGLPGFYCSVWSALFAPKGTPQDVIARLSAAAMTALAEPAVSGRFTELGQHIVPREEQTPEALAALQKAEIEKWWPIIRAAGIRAD